MAMNEAQKTLDDVLKHVNDAKKLIKKARGPIVGAITEASEFYAALQKPLHKLADIGNKRQAERLFDLVKNVGLDSADAIGVLQMDAKASKALLNALMTMLNSNVLRGVLMMLIGNAKLGDIPGIDWVKVPGTGNDSTDEANN